MVPDVLSRVDVDLEESNVIAVTPMRDILPALRNLAYHQETDREIGPVYARLKGHLIANEALRVRVEKKLPVSKLENDILYENVRGQWRIVIPIDLTEDLITFVHEDYCHIGPRKVHGILAETFTWRGMRRQIHLFLRSCDVCQRNKFLNCSYMGPMKSILPEGPGEIIAVDLYGPIPKGKFGNRYLFVIVDIFSKHAQIYPLRKANAQSCVRSIKLKYIPLCGTPKKVLSDNGRQFSAHLWNQEMENLGIEVVKSSIRHPEGNPSERLMREINRTLRTYCQTHHDDWYDIIPHLVRCFNETPHESTGAVPEAVQFGIHPRRAYDDVVLTDPILVDQAGLIAQVRQKIEKESERRKKYKKRKPFHFRVGDLVLLRTPLPSDVASKKYYKFYPLYSGAYRITRDGENNSFELSTLEGRVLGIYNRMSIRPYFTSVRRKSLLD